MSGVLHRRTPIVTIEIPLWPSPPLDASPWWWGLHDLTFRDPVTRVNVWEVRASGDEGDR